MIVFEGLLSDKEIVDVLFYVCNVFGNSVVFIV